MNSVIVHIRTVMRLTPLQIDGVIMALPEDLQNKVRVIILENKPAMTDQDRDTLTQAGLWPEGFVIP